MRNKKVRRIVLLVLFLLLIGIGYAYLVTSATINGTTNISNASWDVHFDNIRVLDGSVTGDKVHTAAHILDDTSQVEFSVTLEKPGDYYEFLIDIENEGSLDAIIQNVTTSLNGTIVTSATYYEIIPPYLNISVTYYPGEGSVFYARSLPSEDTKTIHIKVAYNDNINASQLPQENQTFTLDLSLEAIQE